MNLKECIKGSIAQLMGNKLRSFLTMLGMFIGIGSVIIILSLGDGVKEAFNVQIKEIGMGAVYIESQSWSPENLITQEDIEIIQAMPEVEKLAMNSGSQYSVTKNYKKEDKELRITGIPYNYSEIDHTEILAGRMYTQAEEDAKTHLAVVSDTFAKGLYGRSDLTTPIGKNIEITLEGQIYNFEIIGVYKSGQDIATTPEENLRLRMYVPYGTLDSITGYGDLRGPICYIMINESYNSKEIAYQISRLLDKRHNTENGYYVQTLMEQAGELMSMLNMITAFIGFVAAISLLVGGIGIMNIMLVTVKERTREIGIRKALGATNKEILRQFLIEAVILTVIGGLIGLIIGYLGGKGASLVINSMQSELEMKTRITSQMVLFAVGTSSLIGIIFGVYPAKQAAKLDPVEALRYE